jgi:hypothetical protein
VELNIVWQVDDGSVSRLAQCVPTRRRRKLGANKLVVILSEDVEDERVKAFVGSIAPRTGQTSPGKEATPGIFVVEPKQDPRKTHNAPTLIFYLAIVGTIVLWGIRLLHN